MTTKKAALIKMKEETSCYEVHFRGRIVGYFYREYVKAFGAGSVGHYPGGYHWTFDLQEDDFCDEETLRGFRFDHTWDHFKVGKQELLDRLEKIEVEEQGMQLIPTNMKECGALIYRLDLYGLPVGWLTKNKAIRRPFDDAEDRARRYEWVAVLTGGQRWFWHTLKEARKDLAEITQLGGGRPYREGDTLVITQEIYDALAEADSGLVRYADIKVGLKGTIERRRMGLDYGMLVVHWEEVLSGLGAYTNCLDLAKIGLVFETPRFKRLKVTEAPVEILSETERVERALTETYGGLRAQKLMAIVVEAMNKHGVVFYRP